MSRGRAHLGLQRQPMQLEQGTAAEKLKRNEEIEIWKGRRDKAYSLIHEAVKDIPAALEVATIYHREVELAMSKAEARNELGINEGEENLDEAERTAFVPVPIDEYSAKELKERLIEHFKGGEESALRQASNDFNKFTMKSDKTGKEGAVRLQKFIQELGKFNQAPTESAKKDRLIQGVKGNKRFKFLAIQLTMEARRSDFDGMIQMVKDYDKAVEEVEGSSTEVNAVSEKPTRGVKKCKYKGCKRPDSHTTKDCRYRKKDEDKKKSKPEDSQRQRPGNACYTGCHTCGSMNHFGYECKSETANKTQKSKPSKKRSKKSDDERKQSSSSKKIKVGFNGVRSYRSTINYACNRSRTKERLE